MRRKGHYLNFNAVGCKPPLEHEHQRTGDTGSSPRRQPSGAPNLAVLFLDYMVLHQHDCILFMGKDTLIVFKHNNAHALRGVKDVLVVSHLPSNNTYYGTNVQQQAGPNVRSPTARGIGFVFVSGQVPVDSNGKYLPVESSVTKKTHQVIQNVSSILGASGTSLDQVSKANVYFVQLDRNISRNTARCRS
ncbi:hypothetical protein N7497_006204 [Penicillium chrysogenum]|nr:hypothetical protein N7497_006204 [Penicillium chrysogenum]